MSQSTQGFVMSSSVNTNSKLFEVTSRVITIATLLFIFLVGVKVLGSSFKLMGGGFAQGLIKVTGNPLLGLISGMFATVLIQSSSVTTSIIVGLVASGSLPIGGAVPMIMGANLGTSVTNSLVSLGYVKNKQHFRDAFAAATVHDFFNILTVLVLLPLELMTGFLEKSATSLAYFLYGSTSSLNFSSPIKAAIKPVSKSIQYFVTDILGFQSTSAGVMMAILAAAMIIAALTLIVKVMKKFVESNKGDIIEKLLAKNGYATILFGTLLTFSVQSSSITTSLLVPMAGAGLISLSSILPVTIGANIGTTTTALLASLSGNVAGLAIALVHFLFNLTGMLIWYVHPKMRNIPLVMCSYLADKTLSNRMHGILYITGVFFIIPMILTFVL